MTAKQQRNHMIETQDSSRVGDWIQTYTGKAMFPLDPRVDEISLIDIGHALGNMCRFTGHSKQFYSVAEHSCRVADLVPPEHRLCALLHDASEAYLSDIARPVKTQPQFAGYRVVEDKLQSTIYAKFGLGPEMPEEVRRADEIMLAIEARDLMWPLRPGWEKWLVQIGDTTTSVAEPWTPKESKSFWLDAVEAELRRRAGQ